MLDHFYRSFLSKAVGTADGLLSGNLAWGLVKEMTTSAVVMEIEADTVCEVRGNKYFHLRASV